MNMLGVLALRGRGSLLLQRGFPQRCLWQTPSRKTSRHQMACLQLSRRFSSQRPSPGEDNTQMAYYLAAGVIFVFGLSYASVPLYKVFCQMTGFGGTTQRADESAAAKVKPLDGGKILTVEFVSSVNHSMPWQFEPTQKAVKVVPGETALAFYTVKNPAPYAVTGVATYNVFPPRAGIYFNKIQCFCFEEQRLGAGEEIDMPVFFFVDPAFATDPYLSSCDKLTLSYTFFKTGDEQIEELDRKEQKKKDSEEKRNMMEMLTAQKGKRNYDAVPAPAEAAPTADGNQK